MWSINGERIRLHPLDDNRPLPNQLLRIPLVALLFTVLQALALVVLQQAVLAAISAFAESAVADYGLGAVFAGFETTTYLLRGHASA